jgi:hypothetical protein
MMPNVTISSANLISAAAGLVSATVSVTQGNWWWAALLAALTTALVVEGLWRARTGRT